MIPAEMSYLDLKLADEGPLITLLSPTVKRLQILRRHWQDAIDRLHRGEPDGEAEAPEPPQPLADLPALADSQATTDRSKPNGSSIAFVLSHRGASCLLAADAYGNVLYQALKALATSRGVDRVGVDAVKLPHHGSRANVTRALTSIVEAQHYLVSTNGDLHDHPDDAALARVVVGGSDRTLWFNYPPTTRTARWAAPELQRTHNFATIFAETPMSGLVVYLPERVAP